MRLYKRSSGMAEEMWLPGRDRQVLAGKPCRVTGHLIVHESGHPERVRADLGYTPRSWAGEGIKRLYAWAKRRLGEWERDHDSSGFEATLMLLQTSTKTPPTDMLSVDELAYNKHAVARMREIGLRNAVDDARQKKGGNC